MSLMGSAFGRALAGAGEGMASVAGKYLDEQIAMNKARALEELRVMSEQRIDEYRNSPERRARLRDEDAKDSQARFDQSTQQQLAEAKNLELITAQIEKSNRITEGTAASKAAADGVLTRTRGLNTPHVLAPGQTLTVGNETIAENTRPTPAEASLSAYREGLKGGAKVERMSEGAKVQLQALDKREATIAELIDKGVSNGTLSTSASGPDGKPAPGHDQFRWLRNQQAHIAVGRMRVLAGEGLISGGDDAERLLAGGATAADLEASVRQADQIGGSYAREFRSAIEPALRQAGSTENKRASIEAAARQFGDKDYLVEVDGQRSSTGKALWDKAADKVRKSREEPPEMADVRKREERVRTAQAELQTWGSRKRQSDPQGFARAQQELEAAKAELGAAIDRLGIPTNIDRPAFTSARP